MNRSFDIYCPLATRSLYSELTEECFFDPVTSLEMAAYSLGAGYWFKVFCEVSFDDNYLIENVYKTTFRRLRRESSIELVQRGYKITVKNPNPSTYGGASSYYLVKKLAADFRASAIAVRDRIRPEESDHRTAKISVPRIDPYTIRYGLISRVEPAGALVGSVDSGFWFKDGFSFEFKEESVRR